MVKSASFSEYTFRTFVKCWLPLPACYNLQIDEYAGGSLFRRNVATGVTVRAMTLFLFHRPTTRVVRHLAVAAVDSFPGIFSADAHWRR